MVSNRERFDSAGSNTDNVGPFEPNKYRRLNPPVLYFKLNIMKTSELNVELCDIETFRALFLYCGRNPTNGEKFQFEISFRRNQIDSLVKHLMEYKRDFLVTFNGVTFDGQILQFILDNHHKWYDLTYRQVIKKIYDFAQEIISNQNYELPPPYKEHYLDFRQIDLFKVLHYDNEARRCGLKWAFEFSLDGDIEELPFDHTLEELTDEQIEGVINYCWKDVDATGNGYQICLGETTHPDYKGKNKIQLRLDLIEEYKLPHTAINWNDVKIGAELNKKEYMELAHITQSELWNKVKARKLRSSFMFRDCFPSYVKFETKEFKDFFKKVGGTKVNMWQKQEFPFTYKGTTYMFAKGGGHSNDKPRLIKPLPHQILLDADVGSMYPNIIRKRRIFPVHLGQIWNDAYVGNIPKRLEAKALYKKTGDKKYDNFQECFKLVMNGNFGRLIDRHDFQYDPFAGFSTTIGGEVDIFMLAEDIMQIPTAQIISMNTDGLTVLMDRVYLDQYYKVCRDWEKQVDNYTMGNLEYVEYSMFAQTSVNDYIAVKTNDWKEDKEGKFTAFPIDKPLSERLKKKGDFLTSYELHKNKSKCIIPIALEKFFVEGKPISDTIKEHRNIFDFCIAKKASRDYFYRSIDRSTGKAHDLDKLVRYYCAVSTKEKKKKSLPLVADSIMLSTIKENGFEKLSNGKWFHESWGADGSGYSHDAGVSLLDAYNYCLPEELIPGKLYKIKHERSDKRGPAISKCEADSDQQVMFNTPFKVKNWEEYGIDYSYYERGTNKILDKILPAYKRDRLIKERGQLSLF